MDITHTHTHTHTHKGYTYVALSQYGDMLQGFCLMIIPVPASTAHSQFLAITQ